MLNVFTWWLWLQVIGLAALPLTFRFFRRFPDRGYAFGKALSILVITFVF